MLYRAPGSAARRLAPVSVVIATRQHAHLLEPVLRQCVRNSGDVELELIVVDCGSTDDTPVLLDRLERELPALRWLRTPGTAPAPARNRGIALARHDVVVLLRDDIEPADDNFFRAHSYLHGIYRSSRFAVLSRCVSPATLDPLVWFATAHLAGNRRDELAAPNPYSWLDWRFFHAGNISIKKSIVDDWIIQGFRPDLTPGTWEDAELACRLHGQPGGFRIFFDPASTGRHLQHDDLDGLLDRRFALGATADEMLALHPDVAGSLGFQPIVEALATPLREGDERFVNDRLSVIEGIRSFARLLEARRVVGQAGWHRDLLKAVFRLAARQGFIAARMTMQANLGAAYDQALDECLAGLRGAVHEEIAGHDHVARVLLGMSAGA